MGHLLNCIVPPLRLLVWLRLVLRLEEPELSESSYFMLKQQQAVGMPRSRPHVRCKAFLTARLKTESGAMVGATF